MGRVVIVGMAGVIFGKIVQSVRWIAIVLLALQSMVTGALGRCVLLLEEEQNGGHVLILHHRVVEQIVQDQRLDSVPASPTAGGVLVVAMVAAAVVESVPPVRAVRHRLAVRTYLGGVFIRVLSLPVPRQSIQSFATV